MPKEYTKKTNRQYKTAAQNRVNVEQLLKLCQMRCEQTEILAFFNVSWDTMDRVCKKHFVDGATGEPCSFAQLYKSQKLKGRISLRRKMWHEAMKEKTNTSVLLRLEEREFADETDNDIESVTVTIKKHSQTQEVEEQETDDWDDDLEDWDEE